MMKYIVFLMMAPFLMATTGCPNAFTESANKTSDAALAFSAEQHANNNEWSSAISDMSAMTAAGRALRVNKVSLASYYAGRCGLNLLDLAKSVQDNIATNTIWPLVMQYMKGATAAQAADCKAAEQTMMSITSNAPDRTPDENIEMVFIEFAKMGAFLASSNADANHDGSVDGGFDGCSTASIADASVQELGSGITNTLASLAAAGSSIAGGVSTAGSAMCSNANAIPGVTNFCGNLNASDFSGPTLLALRALLKSNEIGFNTCNGALGADPSGTANDCICPTDNN